MLGDLFGVAFFSAGEQEHSKIVVSSATSIDVQILNGFIERFIAYGLPSMFCCQR
jgi:hypothetical protein